MVISLLKTAAKRSTIDVVTSRGMLYSRGESYHENRFYSDPGDWPRLAEAHRREFLERTDRGVFSQQAEAVVNAERARILFQTETRFDEGALNGVATFCR